MNATAPCSCAGPWLTTRCWCAGSGWRSHTSAACACSIAARGAADQGGRGGGCRGAARAGDARRVALDRAVGEAHRWTSASIASDELPDVGAGARSVLVYVRPFGGGDVGGDRLCVRVSVARRRCLIPLAVLVGASRVFLGVHYPGDVLIGQLIAVLTAIALVMG